MDFCRTQMAGVGKLLAGAALCVAVAACTSSDPARQAASGADTFGDSQWQALLIDDREISRSVRPSLRFVQGVKIRGYAGCNSYFGSVHIARQSMRFLEVGQHMVGCDQESMDQEQRFMAALVAVRSYRVESGRLVLLDEKSTPRLLLEQTFDDNARLNRGEPGVVASITAPATRDGNASSMASGSPASVAGVPPRSRAVAAGPTAPSALAQELPPVAPGAYASSASVPSPGAQRYAHVRDLEFAALTSTLGEYFGTDKGVLVTRAPAENSLLLKEGDVLLSVNGRQPANGPHALRILGSYPPGTALHIELMRKQQAVAFDIVLPP